MAKKPPRSGKPVPGGRVTPKGVRPDGTTTADGHGPRPAAGPPSARLAKHDTDHGRPFVSQPGPTRAGHHRGQR